jgi:uncharacterized protein
VKAAPWPYKVLDIGQLRVDGWQPTAARELIVKVHQRCNLSCDYCYVYQHPDQSWRERPTVMSDEIWQATVDKLANHVRKHAITRFRVILHGGEPLLVGPRRLGRFAEDLRTALPPDCQVDVGLQTNGVLLKADTMSVLRQQRISVGVSVDGTAATHDRHRSTVNNRGSFTAVRAALDLLRRDENRASYAGILCVVDPDTDPIACYEQLAEFEPPAIDLLLPHANWNTARKPAGGSATPHADWLVRVFDRWYEAREPIKVRLFQDIINAILGGPGQSEQVGLSPAAMLVVETDGAIEQVDALKTAYEGACATGLDIRHDELDAAMADPGVIARQIGSLALPVQCRTCPILQACGGGHYAHRYSAGEGFRNPSVYCEDMKVLIGHIVQRIRADVDRRRPATP